jgi:hypothetical protein
VGARDLADLQRFLLGAVQGSTVVGDQEPLARAVAELLVPSPSGMKPHERLEVYREQFWLRHLGSLDEDFPTLTWALGGPSVFRELAQDYLAAFPPRTWDLQRLGAELPRFVAGHRRFGDDQLSEDAARLDWAFMEAFDAPDSPPFDTRVLASTPEDAWPGARIELHASLRLLRLDHPVHELRSALQRGDSLLRPASAPTRLVVHRDARCLLRAVAVESLPFDLLETLHHGTPLGEACEAVARASGRDSLEVGAELGGWFQQWTSAGWIRAVRITGPSESPPAA